MKVAAATLAVALLSGCGLPVDLPEKFPAPTPGAAPQDGIPEYDRDYFGPAWRDTDRNGCDQRNDVLQRDLEDVVFKPGTQNCVVASGVLVDPYSGEEVVFTRGQDTSMDVQIDHVVPLVEAWVSGGYKWSPQRRIAFANDPANLLAVKGVLNSTKGGREPARGDVDSDGLVRVRRIVQGWVPPSKDAWCSYAADWESLKATYGLHIDPDERAGLNMLKETC